VEIRILTRWLQTWLDPKELEAVSIGTSPHFDDELAGELPGDIEPSDGKDDDIPF